jgi:hypothetical protein
MDSNVGSLAMTADVARTVAMIVMVVFICAPELFTLAVKLTTA